MTFCKGNPRADGEMGKVEVYVFSGYFVSRPSRGAVMMGFVNDDGSAGVLLE